MNWYPMRVLSSVAVIGAVLACHRSYPGVPEPQPSPTEPPASATTMNTRESSRQHATSIEQLLEGRLRGVTVTALPSGGMVVRMFGPTSFYSGQEPLFVIDGVPTDVIQGRLAWLDPHDVESITALRDPSSTAQYGVRGANGVIVIKTKGSH
ncbi:MAG TPA: TonB-dependent receptor plug domain-containing protein [Gemmatimonadales bacterium]